MKTLHALARSVVKQPAIGQYAIQLETPYFAFTEIPGPPPKNYGADISALIRMIEAGEL